MRGLHASFLAAVTLSLALAGACATSTPVHETTGRKHHRRRLAPRHHRHRDAGLRRQLQRRGLPAGIDARCCDEGKVCGEDPNCLSCVGKTEPSMLRETNQELADFTICLQGACAEACLGGAGTSSTSDGAGGAPTTSTGASSSSVAASSSSTAASSSVPRGEQQRGEQRRLVERPPRRAAALVEPPGGGAPTCATVDGDVGCCDAAGFGCGTPSVCGAAHGSAPCAERVPGRMAA